jgi:hypothetical protein
MKPPIAATGEAEFHQTAIGGGIVGYKYLNRPV